MSIGFPYNTVFWLVMSMFGTAISVWFILSRGLSKASLPRQIQQKWRMGLSVVLGLGLLARLAFAVFLPGGGSIAALFATSFSFTGVIFLAGLLPLLFSSNYRRMIRSIPVTWLIGVQAIRVEGFFFLALNDMKLLPAGFALPAGNGDIIAGLLALGTIGLLLLRQQKPYTRALAVAFNLYGLADLFTAQITGAIFFRPFVTQLAASGIALNYLNYALLIPSFGVPVMTVIHLYSLYQLAAAREKEALRAESYQQTPASSR